MPNITVGELKRHGTASSVAGTDTVMIIQGNAMKETTVTSLVDAASTQTDQTITTLSTTTIQGVSDSNTTIVFGDDSVVSSAGGVEFWRMVETTQDVLTFNNGAVDIDFTAKKLTSGNWLNYDGGNDALSSDAATVALTGVLSNTAPQVYDHNTTITAFAGGGQASATALTGEFNNVTTVATAFDSVKLLTAVAGQVQTVKNSGAATLSVFPNTSDSIDALAVNLSVDIPVGGMMTFRAISSTVWETHEVFYSSAPSTQKGGLLFQAADSAGNTITTVTNASQAAARTYTIPDAGGSASFVMTEGAQTINGTKTIPAIVTTNLDAGASGTAGTVDIFPTTASRGKVALTCTDQTGDTTVSLIVGAMATTRAITLADPGATANILTDVGIGGRQIARCSTQFDAVSGTTGTTLTNVIGMVLTVIPGTYKYRVCLPGVATANSGIKAAFKLTTTVLTSIEATGLAYTASAVAVQHTTTTTDQTAQIGSTSAAIYTVLEGSMVVGTGGTIQIQAAQNASHTDTTSVYVGATFDLTRFA